MNSLSIEKTNSRDLPEILAIQRQAFQGEAELYDEYHIPPLKQSLEELQQEFQQKQFLSAVEDRRVVGSARGYIKNGQAWIERVIVHPEYQNRGIGQKLMDAMEELLQDAEKYCLFTGHKSERNLHVYGKRGYKIVAREEQTPKVTLVIMEKPNDRL